MTVSVWVVQHIGIGSDKAVNLSLHHCSNISVLMIFRGTVYGILSMSDKH